MSALARFHSLYLLTPSCSGILDAEHSCRMLQNEDMQLREQIDRYNMRMREFNEKQRQYRGQQERTPDQDLEVSSPTRNKKPIIRNKGPPYPEVLLAKGLYWKYTNYISIVNLFTDFVWKFKQQNQYLIPKRTI